MHWPGIIKYMPGVVTRSQIPTFENEIKRISNIKVEQTNNSVHYYTEHIVYQPKLFSMGVVPWEVHHKNTSVSEFFFTHRSL